jgi:hypothetical protein
VDHNNIDADRPLRFDDAESIAYREQSLEMGLALQSPQRGALGLGVELEYLYGFALNSQLQVGLHPSVGGRTDSRDTRFDVEDVSLGAFHSFNREHDHTPALALRGDLFLPTGRGARGVAFRLRGIMSRSIRQYDRLHLNLDLNVASSPRKEERQLNPALIVGYSAPLGYPRVFTRTGLAELAVQSGPERGTGPLITAGVGLRQQVSVRSVVDVGLESDIAGFRRASRDRIRLTAGYSTGF